MQFKGTLYRALNPIFAREPLSGRGAQLYGGRFNAKGTAALYTSLSIMTALREANQVGSLQPTTLVSYEAEIENIFDCRNARLLRDRGVNAGMLADPRWRDQMKLRGISATQILAQELVNDGYHGLMVGSFAPGATADDVNLVLWTWAATLPSRVTVIDDEHRLSS